MNVSRLLLQKKYARAVAAGCVALAAGGMVLLHGSPHADARTSTRIAHAPGGAARIEFTGPHLHGRAGFAQAAIAAHGPQQVFAEIRIGADSEPTSGEPRPVAMAVVLDTSGSMSGEKIEQARNAVLDLLNRMRDNDEISFVTYSDSQQLVQPLARVADVRDRLRAAIPTVQAGGGTIIPRALEMGASSLQEAPSTFVRRIVLVSDGQDGSGQPLDSIEQDVRRRANTGVTLSSLGVGSDYDERFRSGVADAGRGNYEFLQHGAELREFLARELQQASRTTVDQAMVDVTLPSGWHLNRVYGAEVTQGNDVSRVAIPIGALFSGDQRRVILDMTAEASEPGSEQAITVGMRYRDVVASRDVHIDGDALSVRTVGTDAEANATRDIEVFAEAQSAAIAARQSEAVTAWRDGNAARGAALAQQNAAALQQLNTIAHSGMIAAQADEYARDVSTFTSVSAASTAGRAYGLSSNVQNRHRQQRASAF